MKSKTSRQRLRQFIDAKFDNRYGCADSGCIFGHSGGMGTNGGCGCIKHADIPQLRAYLSVMREAALTFACWIENQSE